jgi:hypothetical protein
MEKRVKPALAALRRITAEAAARGAPVLHNRTAENMTGTACTLNGIPAVVCGRLNAFATVAALDPAGPRAEFSWHAVANVLDSGGTFLT